MMAAAARICGWHNAPDIAQDVFLRVWSHPDAFDSTRGTLTNYLYVVTRGTSMDWLRFTTRQRARDTTDIAGRSLQTDSDLGSEIDARERHDNVRRALATLRENERDMIYAAFYGHLTYRDVAERFGVPEGTVKSQIRRAMFKLRTELADAA